MRENLSRWEYLVLFDFILNSENQDKKNAHIVWDMRQVYKGEIEEKLLTDYSNQLTNRIIHENKILGKYFSCKVSKLIHCNI